MQTVVSKVILLIGLVICCISVHAAPSALNVSVTTQQGQLLNIDLSNSVDGIAPVAVTIDTPPPASEGTIELNGLSVNFLSALGFFGTTQFTYKVTDSDVEQPNLVATATVSVTVTPLSIPVQPAATNNIVTPDASITNSLSEICAGLSAQNSLTDNEQELFNYCLDLSQAAANGSFNEVNAALAQITPYEIASQIRAGKNLSDQQMRTIGGRVAALHRGSKGASLIDLSLIPNDGLAIPTKLSLDALSGGAAGESTPSASSRWGTFLSAVIGSVKRDKTQQEEGFDVGSYSGTAGADYRFARDWVVGGAFGLAASEVTVGQNTGNVAVNGINLSAYTTYYLNQKSYVDAILSYSNQAFKIQRHIVFTLNGHSINTQAQATTHAGLLASSIGGGYEVMHKKGFTLNAKFRFDYATSSIDSYQESNAGALNLNIESQHFDSLITGTGLQGIYIWHTARYVLQTQLDLDWQHEFLADATVISGSFNNDVLGTPFKFETDQPDRYYIGSGLGLTLVFPGGNTLYAHVSRHFAKHVYQDLFLAIGARLELG